MSLCWPFLCNLHMPTHTHTPLSIYHKWYVRNIILTFFSHLTHLRFSCSFIKIFFILFNGYTVRVGKIKLSLTITIANNAAMNILMHIPLCKNYWRIDPQKKNFCVKWYILLKIREMLLNCPSKKDWQFIFPPHSPFFIHIFNSKKSVAPAF